MHKLPLRVQRYAKIRIYASFLKLFFSFSLAYSKYFLYLCARFNLDRCAHMKKTGKRATMKHPAKMSLAVFLLCGCIGWFSACTALEKKQQVGAVVELNGQYLYRSTLDSLTLGLASEDSMRVAQQYISQWAKDLLMYDNAKRHSDAQVERLVEDYRRALYMHAYEEFLVERRMPKAVPDSTAQSLYERMPDRFRLDESIMKGLLVVVPKDAPKLANLRKWLAEVNDSNQDKAVQTLDNIEKYAYQNASGYELFTDKWLTTTDVLAHMPIERADVETKLKTKNQIEITDSLQTYILQVTEKCLRGEQMPMEYARPQIEKIILSARQVEFLQKERERLYNEAIQGKKIVFF